MATFVAQEEQPISRTYQYRKVMKPMLERKRRARINRCLDELKELLVGALQAEGESVSRLEKADVLELTVRHLHKLRRSQQLNETGAHDRFKAGFIHCANEVSKYVTTLPSNVDISVSSRLLSHLDGCIRHIDQAPKSPNYPSNHSLLSPVSSSNGLNILTSYTPPASPISSPKNLNGNVVHGNGGGVSGVHPHHNIHGSNGGASGSGSGSGPGSSHVNLLNLSHAKLFAYLPTPSSSADSMGSLSPVPAHHFSPVSSVNGGHFHPHHLNSHAIKPLALCTSNNNSNIGGMTGIHKTHGMYHPMEDEPFDLSNNDNVWRPW